MLATAASSASPSRQRRRASATGNTVQTEADLQWWRAKGSDTFAPLGPAIVTGLDYGNLLLETRINGETVQKQSHVGPDVRLRGASSATSASGCTLEPGDLIYTGTPGSTKKMNPGDTVEVEIGGVGVLRNAVNRIMKTALFIALGIFSVTYVAIWLMPQSWCAGIAKAQRPIGEPDGAIGLGITITNFFDTLGIGSCTRPPLHFSSYGELVPDEQDSGHPERWPHHSDD